MKRLLRRLLESRRVHAYLRAVYREIQPPADIIPEAMPLPSRESVLREPRLNLIIPALSSDSIFGGIRTALDLFDELRKGYRNARIIITDQQAFGVKDNAAFASWEIRKLDDPKEGGLEVVVAGDRWKKTLAVSTGDRFIATAWWTALIAESIQKEQRVRYGAGDPYRYIYLIQDFEPGFYPWSSRYVLAEGTYRQQENMVAVFNSAMLRDYFCREGYRFPREYVLEPRLNARLRECGAEMTVARKRQILVYGRPSVERNAFALIVMGLREWVSRNPESGWVFLSVGEGHEDIILGHGNILRSLGKLSLEEYARCLLESTIGISLMISPHPSYPPLEMAAFGVHVITNGFKGKDLSRLSSRIHSVDSLDAGSLAGEIDALQHKEGTGGLAEGLWLREYSAGECDFAKIKAAVLRDIGHSEY